MSLLDFNDTPKQAFVNGFMKGLGAPLMLFGTYNAPALAPLQMIPLSKTSQMKSLHNDWLRVGMDLRTAVNQYVAQTSKG